MRFGARRVFRGGALTRTPLTIDKLPLFADDDQIGEAVLGRERKTEFSGYAKLRENDGMPPVSEFWGGRYVPAVKAFLDFDQGLAAARPLKENGVEGQWPISKSVRKARA